MPVAHRSAAISSAVVMIGSAGCPTSECDGELPRPVGGGGPGGPKRIAAGEAVAGEGAGGGGGFDLGCGEPDTAGEAMSRYGPWAARSSVIVSASSSLVVRTLDSPSR